MEFLTKYRKEIEQNAKEFFEQKKKDFQKNNNWGDDVLSKLEEFIMRGKLVRGSLVLLINDLYGSKNHEDAKKVAVAIEILHSALLIHDDVFDKDELRRGKPSIHKQYEDVARKNNFSDPKHFGISLATCAGDVGFFLSMELINTTNLECDIKYKVIDIFYKEASQVGLAEMQDIFFEQSDEEFTEQEILKMYTYKTANYTFSLPMMLGALIAEKKNEANKLQLIGEKLGIIFQIKDDEISIFGEEKDTGKTTAIDIRDNKKTIHRLILLKKCNEKEKSNLKKIFGNKNINKKEIELVRNLMKSKEVYDELNNLMKKLEEEAKKEINILELDEKQKNTIQEILKFNMSRIK